jgi:hypothetical protein
LGGVNDFGLLKKPFTLFEPNFEAGTMCFKRWQTYILKVSEAIDFLVGRESGKNAV